MPAITLKAHYDGQQILLDEPFDLPKNSSLMVTVPSSANDQETEQWIKFLRYFYIAILPVLSALFPLNVIVGY